MKPTISLVAAIGKNRELGKGNALLWDIPEDMKHFRETTRGHTVIMGRKTFESIGKPLPNRNNIVITRDTDTFMKSHPEFSSGSLSDSGSEAGMTVHRVAPSIEKALELAKEKEEKEVFVIGGAQIYALALPYADKLYLTLVDKEFPDVDAFFPDYSEFKNIISERKSGDENYSYTFLELTK